MLLACSCCCSLLLMISLWYCLPCSPFYSPSLHAGLMLSSCRCSRAQGRHRHRYRLQATRVHVCVSNCKTGFGSGFVLLLRYEDIQDTWQLLLCGNVYNATHNLNAMPQLMPNRRFQCQSRLQCRIPIQGFLPLRSLTLLKTKFVCTSP